MWHVSNWRHQLLTAGEQAGVKSVEMEVSGRFAYGHLAAEKVTKAIFTS